jgi:glutamate carboxypeptidase
MVRAENLNGKESQIVAAAGERIEEAEALLEQVVNIPSATQNLDGVRAVGKIFASEFANLGFETRWEEMPPTMKRAGHLIAEHKGTSGKRLLLIGHLDTVLEGRKFTRVGRRAHGNGAVDMKGGDVVIVQALKALAVAGRLQDRSIAVILTGDEEDAGEPTTISRGSMIELAKRSDAALAFEALADHTATIARRGVSTWKLNIEARSGHSSGVFGPRLGPGAIFEAARVLEGFRTKLQGEKDLTFNASLILGGTEVDHEGHSFAGSAEGKTNVIPGRVVVEGDLRFLTNSQRDHAQARMRAIVSESLDKTKAEIQFKNEYPAMAPTPGNLALLGVFDKASQDLQLGEIKAYDPGRRGAGDISFVAPFIDGLDGLGVSGEHSHNTEEWVDLDSLPVQIKRIALMVDRLR